jgi:hypothetical protein
MLPSDSSAVPTAGRRLGGEPPRRWIELRVGHPRGLGLPVVDRCEGFVADDRQRGEALGVLRARGGGKDDELLGLVRGSEDLAVEVDEADGPVSDALSGLGGEADIVRVPQPCEFGASTAERLDELAGLVAGVAGVDGADVRRVPARVQPVVLGREPTPLSRVGEPAVEEAALPCRGTRSVCRAALGPADYASWSHRGRRRPVPGCPADRARHERRTDVIAAPSARRCRVSGELEEGPRSSRVRRSARARALTVC